MAAWLIALGVAALGVSRLFARLQRRSRKRKSFTAGTVSDHWLADARGKRDGEWE